MDSSAGTVRRRWVAPFGDPRIEDRMRLPGAFRSLPRPSSPAAAKASAVRPDILDAWKSLPGAADITGRSRSRGGVRSLAVLPRDRRSRARPGDSAKPFLYCSLSFYGFSKKLQGRGAAPPGAESLPLSVRPVVKEQSRRLPAAVEKSDRGRRMVGAHGLGPWTSSLSETRSNQLSYAPGFLRFLPARGPPGNGTVQCAMPGLAPGVRRRGACSFKRR